MRIGPHNHLVIDKAGIHDFGLFRATAGRVIHWVACLKKIVVRFRSQRTSRTIFERRVAWVRAEFTGHRRYRQRKDSSSVLTGLLPIALFQTRTVKTSHNQWTRSEIVSE